MRYQQHCCTIKWFNPVSPDLQRLFFALKIVYSPAIITVTAQTSLQWEFSTLG
jgi:hypothetical protein